MLGFAPISSLPISALPDSSGPVRRDGFKPRVHDFDDDDLMELISLVVSTGVLT